jgi:hypothetical protein
VERELIKAEADDPVFQSHRGSTIKSAAYWTPAFAGMTTFY